MTFMTRSIERMFEVLEGDAKPVYMDAISLDMLEEARLNCEQLGLNDNLVITLGEHTSIVATRAGTVKAATLALALKSFGFMVRNSMTAFCKLKQATERPPLADALVKMASGEEVDLIADARKPDVREVSSLSFA